MVNSLDQDRPKNGSVTLSCRVDRTLYDFLQGDAKLKGISLNSLINSIAKKYISWEKYAAEIGFIPLARETIRQVFDALDDTAMKNIAMSVGKTIPKEMILLMFNRIDFNNIVYFLETTMARYGMVQHNINGDAHYLTVHHRVNKKFSNFLAEAGKAMAEDLQFKMEIMNSDSKILSIRIDEITG